ncbi:MAG: hypothetical protein K2N72_04100 [Oscillospiraceae bacterium]|nr:hypothetical protein [Oscillospiraceae bacterium]
MKKLKTAAVTAVMIGICSLLGGCTAVQVNERMYVQMMGLSEEDGECVLCVQVCSTESAPDEPPVYEFYEGRGEGFRQAAADIEQKNGRELFFGHCTLAALDKNFLYSTEDIKLLMGERISPGCRVCCSDDPGEFLSRKSSGESEKNIGADVISGELDQYEKRGQYKEVTLKDVCIMADKAAPGVLPAFFDEKIGSGAVAFSTGENKEVLYLSANETALCNMLKEENGAEFSVLGGTVKTDKVSNAVYLQTGENILNISINAECTLTETGNSHSLSDYETEAENAITAALSELLNKAEASEMTEAVTGVKTEKGTVFNCNVNVKIKSSDRIR